MPTLQWLTRGEDLLAAGRAPYRLLEEVPALSAGDGGTGNMLVQGDNLEALKALLPFYAGRVKCIFIDPPYNTGSAFEHYDDNLEHTQWLGIMWPRLELLRELLAEDGSIWVTIDDREGHYLKVIMDEVFGRSNFIASIAWEKSDSPRMDAAFVSSRHDSTLCYAKSKEQVFWQRLSVSEDELPSHYNRTDEQGRKYYTKPLRAMGGQGDTRSARPNLYYALVAPDGTMVYPKRQDGTDGAWRWSQEKVEEEQERIEWVSGRNGWTPYFRIYGSNNSSRPPESVWFHSEVGSNRTSKAEVKKIFDDEPFATPKPERLIQRVISIATMPGDLVLDSFAGSGTTPAVAHKMNRRYIGIEMGEHAQTLCAPRLRKVIEGEQGGISKAVKWRGGGGFRFYRLGPPAFDKDGHPCEGIRFPILAAHVWFSETGLAWNGDGKSPLLGIDGDTAYALLYNGVLGDKRADSGNVLTPRTLASIQDSIAKIDPRFEGTLVVYAEQSRLDPALLKRERIVFKQTAYDIKARN